MLGLYLFVRLVGPLLLGGLVALFASRWINARLAKRPAQQIALPAESLLDSPAAKRRYRRMRRRRPNLTHFQVPPQAPRHWLWITVAVVILAAFGAAALTPEGARFQVMVESAVGYPSTVIDVAIDEGQQDALLAAWSPVLMQAVRPVSMRYRRGRYGPPFDSHAVIAVQVRRQGDRLQIATGQPVQAERLRAALATLTPAAAPTVQISERTVAPWRETGWRAWGPRVAR